VLTIHDEFNGPGSGDTSMIGWTPDQISNGNTWTEPSNHVWLESYQGFKVNSSGYAYKNNYDRSANGAFDDKVIIDCGTSGNVRLESRCLCGDQDFAGLCMWSSPTSDVPEIYARFRRNNSGRFVVGVNDGTTLTILRDITGLTTAGYDLVNPCFLTMELSGSILTVELYEDDQTTLIASYTGSIAGYGLTPTNYVGMQMAGFSNSTRQHYDFKVYTPPVEATRKINWDTYEDGVWEVTGFAAITTTNATSQTQIKASSTFTMPSEGFYNTAVRSRYHSDSTDATAPQYVAIWDVSASAWYVQQYARSFGTTGAYIWQYGIAVYGGTFTPVDGQDYVFVYLTKDPGGITGWSNYA